MDETLAVEVATVTFIVLRILVVFPAEHKKLQTTPQKIIKVHLKRLLLHKIYLLEIIFFTALILCT